MKPRLPYIALLCSLLAACDAVHPDVETQLVVESYAFAGGPLPDVHLRRTLPLGQPYPLGDANAASGAEVVVRVGDASYAYAMGAPGVYQPMVDHLIEARWTLNLDVVWEGRTATATTRVPPPLALDSVLVVAGESPLSGLILDSLFIDRSQIDTLRFDSLRTGASEGYVYLVEVTMQWMVDFAESGPDGDYWIRTELRPYLEDRTKLDDYFLRPDQLLREALMKRDTDGRRQWTGVYAVPVEDAESPLPSHRLRVAMVRGTQAYARFVSGSDSPKHREPQPNITGALGIFAGLSIDSLSVVVQ